MGRKLWKHFKTITKHKWYVFNACRRAGILWRGIKHDLSKFGFTEFVSSAKYFQGNKSPIDAEKEALGYSKAWAHHKGRNSHHWEYWTDWKNGELYCMRMPLDDVKELMCDWIGAGKAYNRDKWSCKEPLRWYELHKDKYELHQNTRSLIERNLKYLALNGEKKFFEYIQNKYYFRY